MELAHPGHLFPGHRLELDHPGVVTTLAFGGGLLASGSTAPESAAVLAQLVDRGP